jgi:hypothetical protein
MTNSRKKALGSTAVGNVANPKSVLDFCLPVLKDHFHTENLGFTFAPRARRVSRYELRGLGQQIGTARERYSLHLLSGGTGGLYWAAVVVEFRFVDPAYELINIEIVVFKGEAYEPKLPFFRAEWHCSPADLLERHAQPHWHVYIEQSPRSESAFDTEVVSEFRLDEVTSEISEAQTVPFHFAMSSSWQEHGMDAHRQPVNTVLALQNWLNGCLGYIRSQLQ